MDLDLWRMDTDDGYHGDGDGNGDVLHYLERFSYKDCVILINYLYPS